MSQVQRLLQQLCPEGVVEFAKLGDVCEIKTGQAVSKHMIDKNPGCYPVINSGREPLGFINEWNTENDPIGVTTRGAGVGSITWQEGKYYRGNLNYSVKIKKTDALSTRFLYHVLLEFQPKIQKLCTFQGIPALNASNLKKLEIPLPPLPIQNEIVNILDKFTTLEAELEAELDCRKRQYQFYRDRLLSFKPIGGGTHQQITWKKMSEIGTFTRGKRFVRTDIVEEGVPCIHYGDIYTHYGLRATEAKTHLTPEKAQKMRFAKKGDVIIVGAGENNWDIGVGVAWLGDEDVAVHDACYIFTSDLEPRYVSHYLRTTEYHLQIKKHVSEGKICSISAQSIGRAVIAVPPLTEQRRIADILDRFERLTTDLQSGLPAEIHARHQQYEHYRNRLLTFKRKTTE